MSSTRNTCLLAISFVFVVNNSCNLAYSFDPSTDDLWDIRQGIVVTQSTPVAPFSLPTNMFGGDSEFLSPGHSSHKNTLFLDFAVGGQVHAVEWRTPVPITLESFVLNAGHSDLPGRDFHHRGFSRFTLYAFNYATELFDHVLFELFPSNPFGITPSPPNAAVEFRGNLAQLSLAANVPATTTDRFRAEFEQPGDPNESYASPRIYELDGFDTPFPDLTNGFVGDTNGDRRIDLEDLNNVRNHFGEGEILGPPIFGEAFPFDGIVDIGDLNRVRNNFGTSAAIPEPTALVTFLLSALVFPFRSRERRSPQF